MKTLKLFTAVAITAIIGFTSCQSEESTEVGTNPNANSSTSKTAAYYERTAMNDGSNDDFLDDNSCTELLFPLTAIVNGEQITILSKLDFSLVFNIMGELNDDSDTVIFNFPLSVRMSNYTEVVVNNQSDLDALKQECENAASQEENAISCIDIDFPVTMLTYNVALEQTGSVVLQSEKQLYTFINDLHGDELFSVNYPISATLSNGTAVQINSDEEFKNSISECMQIQEEEEDAAASAEEVEAIVTNSKFRVDSFISGGVNKAVDYADWSIEFTNDLKLIAKNHVNSTVSEIEGTYNVSSDIAVFLNIAFGSNNTVSALNNEWLVTSYSNTVVTLQNKTDASITLSFKKI